MYAWILSGRHCFTSAPAPPTLSLSFVALSWKRESVHPRWVPAGTGDTRSMISWLGPLCHSLWSYHCLSQLMHGDLPSDQLLGDRKGQAWCTDGYIGTGESRLLVALKESGEQKSSSPLVGVRWMDNMFKQYANIRAGVWTGQLVANRSRALVDERVARWYQKHCCERGF